MDYEAIVGMEVHAQLLTASKMFCGCSADYASAAPNTHVCPVCLGMPGVLPVINQAAVEATLLTGLALNCHIPEFSKFDRKNYPYPDLPKGYQISQYDMPLCMDGWLEIEADGQPRRIRIRRVHLEEDTAKLFHQGDSSLIDFNRAGVPLMEIVSEADIRTAEEAWQYLVKLRTILRYLQVSTGNMEEGAMRCEVNISLRPASCGELGTKVEIKNLNSFRAVRQAIAFEIRRQSLILDDGGRVRQVTVGWDETHGRTVFQRSKEGAEDYRYFPEPDLPPLQFSQAWIQEIRERLPELPDAKLERITKEYGLKDYAGGPLLVEDPFVADFFEAAAQAAMGTVEPRMVANWTVEQIRPLWRDRGATYVDIDRDAPRLAELLALIDKGTINATVGKEVLSEMFASGESPLAIVERSGLTQVSDEEELNRVIQDILEANPKPARQFLEGKETVLGFFIGQVMRATRGKANVHIARRLLREELARRKG